MYLFHISQAENVDTFLISNFYLYHVGPEISHKKISIRRHLTPQKWSVRNRIVDIHNHFRASVKPPAKNMLKMVRSYSHLKYLCWISNNFDIFLLGWIHEISNVLSNYNYSIGIEGPPTTPSGGLDNASFSFTILLPDVTSMTSAHVVKIFSFLPTKFHG